MAVSIKAGTSFYKDGNLSSFAMTSGAGLDPGAGSNRLLVITAHSEGSSVPNSATWNGVDIFSALTLSGVANNGTQYVRFYTVKDASFVGASGELTIGYSVGSNRQLSCRILDDVDQATPAGTIAAVSGTAALAGACSITVPSGGYAIAAATLDYNASETGIAWNGAWTEEYDANRTTNFRAGIAYTTTSGTQDPAPTWSQSVAYQLAVLPINPASGAAAAARQLMLMGVG